MSRCVDVEMWMWRFGDVEMCTCGDLGCGCVDVEMCKCGDVDVWRCGCGDVEMCRCGDV